MPAMEESGQTQQPTTTQHHAGPRRARVALACQRCKGRKQRCDGTHPTCKSCIKAGISCVYEPTLRPRYPGGKMLYINALEERIAFLEGQLPEYGQDHFAHIDPQKDARRFHKREASASTTSQFDGVDEEDSTLVDGVAYLSLCASGTTDTAPEPFYMGSSSGATIARMIQSSIFRARKSSKTSQLPLSTLRSGSTSSATSCGMTTPCSTEFPPLAQAQRLFSVFFNRLHTRWPILDRKLYEHVFKLQYQPAALPIIEKSSLHLIYAISARFLQLTKQTLDVGPEAHFAAALEPMDSIMEQHNSATVQFLTLLAIYGQRSPYGAGVWSQVRYSITLCVELGMHRKPTTHSPARDPRDLEIRRRIFWSCYCLDRLTSILLGRTFAISDRDINVELPSEDPVFWDLTSTQPLANDGKGWSNISPFIHIVKLRQLQSKTQRTVFRVDIDHTSRSPADQAHEDAKVTKIRAELDSWVKGIPDPPPAVEGGPSWMYQPETVNPYHDSRDFFTLQYHKTILSLYTGLLPSLAVGDARFVSCAQSSARICATYKHLHQQKILSFTIIGLHSCFVAGLTLIYCLWRDKTLFSFDILEATRSCSQCLTIFGEKWPGAVKYGEIFEALSGSVLRAIMEPGGQESGTQNLRLDLDMFGGPTTTTTTSSTGGETSTTVPKTSDPLLGAVKDVFMEVDEDVPGGWQGWRVFNEMVQSDIQKPNLATGEIPEAGPTLRPEFRTPAWNDDVDSEYVMDNEFEGLDPGVQVGEMGMGIGMGTGNVGGGAAAFGDQGGWDHGFFAGYD
ncbi:fungal-specific transcription factor domain-containing protein [Pleomassaria siparia CBS 279.74]|uniref:Fungal-specific transcription factor domain-containing protein n=1 Tax=Pleomassaria siparia CBS 279.74 TaxID=1314801 RepID=A0A6G1JYM3_9PLEO|nr:fungal-specific transcription factor domain-containing protein [Pleomassaria siparia CBS 279.74]